MTEVTCTECKKTTTVPFTPTPGKPVYCDECFKKKRAQGPPGGRGGPGGPRGRRGEPVVQKQFSRSDYPGHENFQK